MNAITKTEIPPNHVLLSVSEIQQAILNIKGIRTNKTGRMISIMHSWILRAKVDQEYILAMVSLDEIIDAVCEVCGISRQKLMHKTRKRTIVRARQVIYYIASIYTPLTQDELGEYFGFDRTSVRHGIELIKDQVMYDDIQIMLQRVQTRLGKTQEVAA